MKERNTHSMYSVICGHDKSVPTVGARWCKRWVYEGKYYVFVE